MLRKLPPAAYLLALICFLLPFVEVSCNGQKIVSLTGLQLLAGPQIGDGSGMFAQRKHQAKPETSVVVAFVAGIAGLVLSVLKQRRTDIFAGVCGILAGGALPELQQSDLVRRSSTGHGADPGSVSAGVFPQRVAVLCRRGCCVLRLLHQAQRSCREGSGAGCSVSRTFSARQSTDVASEYLSYCAEPSANRHHASSAFARIELALLPALRPATCRRCPLLPQVRIGATLNREADLARPLPPRDGRFLFDGGSG